MRFLERLADRLSWKRRVSTIFEIKGLFGSRRPMLFTPTIPTYHAYLITKICNNLGLRPVASGAANIGIFWSDATTSGPPVTSQKLINGECLDISKRHIQEAFARVFDYPLAVDPLTYRGKAVCKSDANAAHDGYVVDCPVTSREEGRVYEVLVDNSDGNAVEDIRVVVVGDILPLAYRKRREISKRFQNTNFEVGVVDPATMFSETERKQIISFSREIGLDFGELDTLRDKTTGRLYIVDAAKTAFGPPEALPNLKKIKAVRVLSKAFSKQFLTT